MAMKKATSVTTDVRRTPTPAPTKPVPPQRRPDTRTNSNGARTPLRAGQLGAGTEDLRARLEKQVIGQGHAIDAVVSSWARLLSGLRDSNRPLLTALLMGPTGVGKTETTRALATALFGTEQALHRINCEEYAHGHEVAKLLGSPPGYVGADIEPLLSQRRIDRPHFEQRQAAEAEDAADVEPLLIEQVHDLDRGLHSILLFDEVEKAHPTVWNALLGILDEGRVTLGDNTTTDLKRSVILMTTNVGSREMGAAVGSVPLGFAAESGDAPAADALAGIAANAAREAFPAEFLNRFDQTLVYHPLRERDLSRIFDKFLGAVNERTIEQAGVPMLIKTTSRAKALVVESGTDPGRVRCGVRSNV